MTDIAIIIPSRIGSTRLANKPLIKIHDKTMIEHVYNAALSSGVADVYVATDSKEIEDKINSINGKTIFVDEECSTGTDRVYKAVQKMLVNPKIVVNLQGDMPFIDSNIIKNVALLAKNGNYDIVTAASYVDATIDSQWVQSYSNVKVVCGLNKKALYFSRQPIPYNARQHLSHIGIYAFKINSLHKFANLPQSSLEICENLEQLRALENGMSIGVEIVNSIPVAIDTKQDLELLISSAR